MSRYLALILLSLSSAFSAYAESLEAISSKPYWLKLNHYEPALITGWQSTVDSGDFFLSKDGKTNPKAELDATLFAFKRYADTFEAGNDYSQETVCQYPARFRWLNAQLSAGWPQATCKEMATWKEAIQPKGMTLVFPTAFMNNPSSMFGHTLLRIDAQDQTRHKELVAFAVNFAALPDNSDDPATYALKGLTGMYPGGYSLMPYHQKVREYNDLESRDMWEYELKLSEEEVNNILLHLWELKEARFDYYFIDENCSYQLLALLQLAREDLDLISEFNYHVIPSDTVAVLRDAQLLSEPSYRAASGTKLLFFATQLTEAEVNASKLVMEGKFPEEFEAEFAQVNSVESLAKVYEMAYEWLNYQYYDDRLLRDETAPLLTKILIARSKLKIKSPLVMPEKPALSPEKGHGSARMGLGYNWYNHESNAVSLNGRLNYHDLFDAPGGFIPGAQISFFDFELTANDADKTRLERFYIMDAFALPADNLVFDSWSWNARLGFDRQPDENKSAGRWFFQSGYGKSWGQSDGIHGFLLLSGELNSGDIVDNNFRVGGGLEGGLLWQMTNQHRVGLQVNQIHLADAKVNKHSKINITWQWSPTNNWGIRAESGYLEWHDNDAFVKLNGFYYF